MNIKILDSWLREYLKTKAEAKTIAKYLSLSSVSVERLEKHGNDFSYDIEVTTNRPDLMSVVGLAREASVVLRQNGIGADFVEPKIEEPGNVEEKESIDIKSDAKLVNRVCAVVMEVKVKPAPKYMAERLEADGIRSHNNLIDITNYVMRTTGHPCHVFDFDRLNTKELLIRESTKGEEIVTLDNKSYSLPGGDIIAVDDKGRIVDLLGIMGLENSVVTDETKRILYFLDNNDPVRLRKTSMKLAIRTEAVILNEKNIDPELAKPALLYGIKLFEELAEGKVVSELIDIYPNRIKPAEVSVSEDKINSVTGATIPLATSEKLLSGLGFDVKISGSILTATAPTFRARDIQIPEDLIEEIARIYGYDNIPNKLPDINIAPSQNRNSDNFYWEKRIKEALKYWGFTEVYTYSMVGKNLLDNESEAVKVKNPLSDEFTHMRQSLWPSLLKVAEENQTYEKIKIFEAANVYRRKQGKLPAQILRLSALMKWPDISFFHAKGIVEQLGADLGVNNLIFEQQKGEVMVRMGKENLGRIIYEKGLAGFEVDLDILIAHATMKKSYVPVSKFPPVLEDLAIQFNENISTGEVIEFIKKQSPLIKEVSLLDKFENTRTFHIVYQSNEKNLAAMEIEVIRKKITGNLGSKFNIRIK